MHEIIEVINVMNYNSSRIVIRDAEWTLNGFANVIIILFTANVCKIKEGNINLQLQPRKECDNEKEFDGSYR